MGIIFTADHQIDEIHNITRKTDIADQLARTISIETTNQEKTQTEVLLNL